jgi:hypothetical protein
VAALAGGTLYEVTLVVIPRWLRRSRLYRALVEGTLRIVVELVGGVQGAIPHHGMGTHELAARKLAGSGIELASLLTVGWSPLWLLAAAADVTGGTRVYLRALVAELRQGGVLPRGAEIGSADELLSTLEHTSATIAEALDVPPLTVDGMRGTLSALRENAARLPGPGQLASIFAQLRDVAQEENRSLRFVSAAIGRGALRAGLEVGQAQIFNFYREALGAISAEGLATYTRRVSRPYWTAAAEHFDPGSVSHTQRVLGRIRGSEASGAI